MSAPPARQLSDATLEHLRRVADAPDLEGSRYELVATLGRGGMGAVYEVLDRDLGRHVALKVVRAPEPVPDATARMLREARTLAGLEHPGIVPVHDVGTLPDGRVFYTMKLVRGRRLDDFAGGPALLPERLRVLGRVCEAVAFAHAHGVIHRDLKPENIMVGAFGEVLVLDWGVAKRRLTSEPTFRSVAITEGPDDDGIDTGHGIVLGTPGYMAPEQALGEGTVDERADVYALGALLRFLVHTHDPDGPAPRLRRPLQAIVWKAMAMEASSRYPGAEALAADIAAFAQGLPVSAYTERPLERIRRLATRYRTPILLVLAYLVMRAVLVLALGR